MSVKFRIGDAVVIAVVLLAALLCGAVGLIPAEKGNTVEVRTATDTVRYPLDVPGEYTVMSGGYTLVLTVENGTARVSASDCRCGICTAHKPVSNAGESIVCVPAGVVVRIAGEGSADGEAG